MFSLAHLFDHLTCTLADAIRSLPGMADPDQHKPPAEPAAEQSDTTKQEFRASGMWTAFGLWLTLLVTAFVSGGFVKLWSAIIGFMTFNLDPVRAIDNSFVSMLSILAAVVSIKTPTVVVIGATLNALYGTPKSHQISKMFTGIKHHYMIMTVTVTAEELIARGFFLGLIAVVAGNGATGTIYLFFVIGNTLWAIIHLANFKDKKERHIARVIPQFVSGVFFTIVFLNFGLLGALMVHLAFNNLLMSTMRKGIFNMGETLVIVWHACIAAAGYLTLTIGFGKSLTDLVRWFDADGHDFVIAGWDVWCYMAAVLCVTSILSIVAELLFFDLHPTQIEAAGLDGVGRAMVLLALSFVSFFGLQALDVPFDVRVLIMALVFLLVRKSASGSGMARVFWIGLPVLMLQLFAVLALGWDSAAWLVALAVSFADLPDRWIRLEDAKREKLAATAKVATMVRQQAGLIFASRAH